MKLVRSEPESEALRTALDGTDLISSALLQVEGLRAARRYGDRAVERARVAITAVTLVPVDADTLDLASRLEPLELRSLDAIHLAAALRSAEDLETLYCYDRRLAAAAADAGLPVSAPA